MVGSLGQAVFDDGVFQGKAAGFQNLLKNTAWSSEKIFEILQIPKRKQKSYINETEHYDITNLFNETAIKEYGENLFAYKKDIFENKFGIPVTGSFAENLYEQCYLGRKLLVNGMISGLTECIKKLMTNADYSAERAMLALGIEQNDWPEFSKLILNRE